MWFKYDLLIETSKLNILILVYVTLILNQGHSDAKQKLLRMHLSKFSMLLDGHWFAVEPCWSGWHPFGLLLTDFFQTWYDDRHY